jgi:hypothetical protein
MNWHNGEEPTVKCRQHIERMGGELRFHLLTKCLQQDPLLQADSCSVLKKYLASYVTWRMLSRPVHQLNPVHKLQPHCLNLRVQSPEHLRLYNCCMWEHMASIGVLFQLYYPEIFWQNFSPLWISICIIPWRQRNSGIVRWRLSPVGMRLLQG